MPDRPGFLVMVTGFGELRLFSAHFLEQEARIAIEQMESLLATTGRSVHLVEVPELDGIARAAPSLAPESCAIAPPPANAASAPAAAEDAAPVRFKSQAEFLAETQAMMEAGEGFTVRDADAPISDGGAYS